MTYTEHKHDHCHCQNHIHEPDHVHEHPKPKEKHWANGTYKISSHLHEGAFVSSGQCHIRISNSQQVRSLLKNGMYSLASQIQKTGGYIGHIKASISETSFEMFSITDNELQFHPSNEAQLTLNLTAIAFFVTLQELENQVEKILKECCELSE